MVVSLSASFYLFFFFFNDTATTEIYTLSLHDALPIRSDSGETAYVAVVNVVNADRVNQSWRGPSRTRRRTGPAATAGRGLNQTGAGAPPGGPRGSASPLRRTGGPRPERVSVARLPSTGSTAMPPAIAR